MSGRPATNHCQATRRSFAVVAPGTPGHCSPHTDAAAPRQHLPGTRAHRARATDVRPVPGAGIEPAWCFRDGGRGSVLRARPFRPLDDGRRTASGAVLDTQNSDIAWSRPVAGRSALSDALGPRLPPFSSTDADLDGARPLDHTADRRYASSLPTAEARASSRGVGGGGIADKLKPPIVVGHSKRVQ